MRQRKPILTYLLTGAIVALTALATPLTAAASENGITTYYNGGMASASFCVQNPTVNNTWLSPINAGRDGWNGTGSPADISVFSGCTSQLLVGSYGAGWLGLYTPMITGYQYQIQLDSSNLNSHINQNGYTFANVVRSTTAHEFGHALSLGHNDVTYSLMCSARNRNAVYYPHAMDLTEVNEYY